MKDLRINTTIKGYYNKFQRLKRAYEKQKGLTKIQMTDFMRLLIDDAVEKYKH